MESKEVSRADYSRLAVAMGYICTELKGRCSPEAFREICGLVGRLAGERGMQELRHIGFAFSGLYDLFRPPMDPGGVFDEPERRSSGDLRGGSAGRYG